jgi:hypothetical protein
MQSVYQDFGIACTSFGLTTDQNTFYTQVSTALAANRAVDVGTLSTIAAGAPLIAAHAYSVFAVTKDAAGTVWVTLRNPWGIDGVTWDNNSWDGILTMTYATMKSSVSSGSILT